MALTEAAILELVRSYIPKNMENNPDLCMLQGFYAGHAQGIKDEREALQAAANDLACKALAELIRGHAEDERKLKPGAKPADLRPDPERERTEAARPARFRND